MMRRYFLTGAVTSLASSINSRNAPTLPRGLWRDELGNFAIGEFPEFGKGLFAFDYTALQVGPLSHLRDESWAMAGTLDGSGASVRLIHAARTALRIGNRYVRPVPIQRTSFDTKSEAIALSCEIAAPAEKRARGTIMMI